MPNTLCVNTGENATAKLLELELDPNETQVIGSAELYYHHSVLKEIDDITDGIGKKYCWFEILSLDVASL